MQAERPGVVDALEVFGGAGFFEADQGAAVGAAVFKGVNLAVGVPRDHDRRAACMRGAVAAGFRDFGLQTQVVPDGAFVDGLLFLVKDFLLLVDGVGHTCVLPIHPVDGL